MSDSGLNKIGSVMESNHVGEAHSVLEHDFIDFFVEEGYQEVSGIPLISDVDPSVIFTGSSISAIKNILLTGEYPGKGVVLAQECLRTKAYKHAFNNEWLPFGQIYFTMVSNLSRPGRFPEVVEEAVRYTRDHFGVESDRLKIRSTRNKEQLSEVDQMTDIDVEYDDAKESYYHWDYGIPGVHGDGLTIAIYNEKRQEWQDIGNIVIIYDDAGNEIGIEFGYGYEFFLYSALNYDQSLKLSKVYEIFPYEEGLSKKYYSTLEAVCQMKNAGARIGDKKADHVYKQYLKSLEYIGSSLGKSADEVVREMTMYLEYINNDDSLGDELAFFLEYQKRKASIEALIKRIGNYLWNKVNRPGGAKQNMPDPHGLVIKNMLQKGIQEFEIIHLLQRLNRWDFIEVMRKHPDYRESKSKI